MICRQLEFPTVIGALEAAGHHSSVVDEQMQRPVPGGDELGD
jgi:hypothetical protein